MSNVLFKIYQKIKSAKEIWDSLEEKYGSEDLGTKNYAVSKWIKFFKWNKPIMPETHECEPLVSEVLAEGMKIYECL